MSRQSCWTAERIALLKELWAQGATAVVIGARLGGMSRSAVLGKVNRLRLLADGSAARPRPPKPALDIATVVAVPARRRRRTKYKQRSQPVPVVERQHTTIFELTNKTCRWPLSIFIMGTFAGGLAVHFFWHWCPAGSINTGMLHVLLGGYG
jgi:GcrA cell cycle regulator